MRKLLRADPNAVAVIQNAATVPGVDADFDVLAAAVIADAVVRIIPGVISDEQSALSDSFQDNLLAAPVYTRPAEYNGWAVPDILLSGHEAKIKEWELQQSLERTQRLRPDLLK